MRHPARHHPKGARRAALWAAAAFIAAAPALPAAAEGLTTEDCLGCHAGDEEAVVEFGDGSSLSVFVDQEKWEGSIHGSQLGCTDCHTEINDYPHPELTAKNAREFQLTEGATCKRCHYAYYTRMLDGIHYKVLEGGNTKAPTCVDCHGAHAVTDPKVPRLSVNEKCAKCHTKIAETYKTSVHGAALVDGNPDVPVCTDCHGAHAIRDPRKPEFHAASYELCAKCHSDKDRMKKYGLNPAVVTTYLDDFHGRSNKLYQMGAGEAGRPMATCTDCHGVHDIMAMGKDADPKAMEARVVKKCQQCHEGAPPEFASAWLSHYEPTLASSPIVWGVQWLYKLMIPTIMIALVLHILLHLWRVRTHR